MTDVHIYMDDVTGNIYIYNGTTLIPVGNVTPQIGDQGDEDFQRQEEEERQAQIEKEREEEGDDYEEETEEERQARLDDIRNTFGDTVTNQEIEKETERHVAPERKARQAKQRAASKEQREKSISTIDRFKYTMDYFVKGQIQRAKTKSWKQSDMRYEGSGIMRRGKAYTTDTKIPKINVYFDQSGSWGPEDIRVGEEAIGVLNNYVDRGEITIDLYYFANHIHDNPVECQIEGGTGAGRELMEHIADTQPDNVIVMTDSDFDWYVKHDYETAVNKGPRVIVPGAVWFLFRNYESLSLQYQLKGAQETRKFLI